MVIGHNNNNRVVGRIGFSCMKMWGHFFGSEKFAHDNGGVVILTGWSYGWIPLHYSCRLPNWQ